jgi:hypothetical protein
LNVPPLPYSKAPPKKIIKLVGMCIVSWVAVSIVSGYGLDDWAIEVRSLAEAKDFSSSLCIQTSSGAHPASCTMGTGGPFPWAKARPGRDIDHSPPPLVPRSRMSRSYTSSHPQVPAWHVARQLFRYVHSFSLQQTLFV